MSEEFDLSEKIFNGTEVDESDEVIGVGDVKEFIRRLKEHSVAGTGKVIMILKEELDKLAGEKLRGV
jgi:hypothetical protein